VKRGNPDDVEPLDPGCPYCSGPFPHPHSSRPAAPAPKKVEPVKPKALPAHTRPEPESLGKLAYDTWVEDVGHGAQVLPWDKLTARVQETWSAVGQRIEKVVERRVLQRLVAEQLKNQEESRRG
jgi:hypothetical protein